MVESARKSGTGYDFPDVRSLGSESFVKRLEGMLVRKLDPKRTGGLKKAFAAVG